MKITIDDLRMYDVDLRACTNGRLIVCVLLSHALIDDAMIDALTGAFTFDDKMYDRINDDRMIASFVSIQGAIDALKRINDVFNVQIIHACVIDVRGAQRVPLINTPVEGEQYD